MQFNLVECLKCQIAAQAFLIKGVVKSVSVRSVSLRIPRPAQALMIKGAVKSASV